MRTSLARTAPRRVALVLALALLLDLAAAAAVYVDRRDDPVIPDFTRAALPAARWDLDLYRGAPEVLGLTTDLPEGGSLRDGRVRVPPSPDRPDQLLRFALGALNEPTADARRLAADAVRQVLVTRTDGSVPHYSVGVDERGSQVTTTWYSPATEGMLLSALARLYEATGRSVWRSAAHGAFSTLTDFQRFFVGSRPAPSRWLTLVDGEGHLWFERSGSAPSPAFRLADQGWAAVGAYDYRRALARGPEDRKTAGALVAGTVATLVAAEPDFRLPGLVALDGLNQGGQDLRAHFAAVAQLRLLARATGVAALAGFARHLVHDAQVPFWRSRTFRLPPGMDLYEEPPPELVLASGQTAPSTDVPGAVPDPTSNARFALGALDRFAQTGRRVWVRRAERAVDEALATALGGVLPYETRRRNVYGERLDRPWSSAEGQGLMVSALVRLSRLGDGERRLDQARGLVQGMLQVRDYGGRPPDTWLTVLDRSGRIWFETYADGGRPSLVVAGHGAALVGLYDFWDATGDTESRLYLEGGLTTLRAELPYVTLPGAFALTSPMAQERDGARHAALTAQVRAFARLTGDRVLTSYARQLHRDDVSARATRACRASVRCRVLYS